jgi:phosphoenolpyruvate carboxylase
LSPGDSNYSLVELCDDLIECTQGRTTSNAVVVPVLQMFNMLLEADVLSRLSEADDGLLKLVYVHVFLARSDRALQTGKIIAHCDEKCLTIEKCTASAGVHENVGFLSAR